MPASVLTSPASEQIGLTGLIEAAAGGGAEQQASAVTAATSAKWLSEARDHFAVVPRCWKKLTRPGAAPTISAAAPEVSAAIRPRAA